jgi:tetrahydromethanopterin S-methyltransferase subunit C
MAKIDTAKAQEVLSHGAKVVADVKAVSAGAKVGLAIVGVLQVAFAFLAFWDLARRDADEVVGPKPVWIPVILVNWIGPAAYYLFGIRHQR